MSNIAVKEEQKVSVSERNFEKVEPETSKLVNAFSPEHAKYMLELLASVKHSGNDLQLAYECQFILSKITDNKGGHNG